MLNVLIPLDGSETAETAIQNALPVIRPFGANIVLLRVITPAEFRSEDAFLRVDWRLQQFQAQTYLEGVKRVFEAAGFKCRCLVREGQPADVILKTAIEYSAQLLVLSSHGRGRANAFLRGGEASKILSGFGASVLFVDAREPAGVRNDVRYRRILVPVDGSHRSETAFRVAIVLAENLGAHLALAFVVEQPKPPVVVRSDMNAVALCQELANMTRAAALRELAVLKSQVPPEIPVSVTVRMTGDTTEAIGALQQRYKADLIIASENLLNRMALAVENLVSASRVPMLLIDSESAGQAFDTIFAQETHASDADAS